MSVKGFDKKQIPIAIGSLVVVIAIMVCILVFGKTTSIPTLETTTEKSAEKTTAKKEKASTTTTTEYTRATTVPQEYKNTGAIIVQGNRAMEIFGKNENGLKRERYRYLGKQ